MNTWIGLPTGTLTHSLELHSVVAIVHHEYMDRFLLTGTLTRWTLTRWWQSIGIRELGRRGRGNRTEHIPIPHFIISEMSVISLPS